MAIRTVAKDANNVPYPGLLTQFEEKSVTFTGAAGAGAIGTIDLFQVTGKILLYWIGFVDTTLVSTTGTYSIGTDQGGTVSNIAAAQTATNLVAGDLAIAATHVARAAVLVTSPHAVFGPCKIQATIATAAITAGKITFHPSWMPISADGNLVAL